MSRLNLLTRSVRICLAVSLCLQLALPVLQYPTVALAAITGNRAPARPAARALPRQATVPTQSAQHLLQLTLDFAVRQAIAIAGWQVSTLDSQLDLAAQQASAQHLSGTGRWHVEVLDEAQHPLTLEGTLAYEIKAQSQDGGGTSTAILLKGTLQGLSTQLAIDANISGDNAVEQQHQAGSILLQLTRAGLVSHITARASGETKPIAYNLTQSVVRSSIDRDGQGSAVVQTLTLHDLGGGESEAWLKSTVNVTGDTAGAGTIDKHFFQRLAGNELAQYLDRYDVESADDHYALQSPAEVTATPDGGARYDLTLVDPQGRTIHLSSGPKKTSQNMVSPSPEAGALGLMGAPAGSNGKHPGLSSPLPLELGLSFETNNPSRKSAGPLWPATFVAGSLLSGCDASCYIFWAAVAAAIVITIAILPVGSLFLVLTAEASAGAVTALGATVAVSTALAEAASIAAATEALPALMEIILALLGAEASAVLVALTNADPYFVRPDTRPAQVPANPPLLQLTRVTGGLVTTTTLVSAATISVTLAGGPGGASGTGGPSFDSYNDHAPFFVGNAIPAGAAAIGDWTWDAARIFGASASHTQPAVAGAQQHYFIHAAQTITVSSSDNLVQYVYLDAQHPPAEIYVQFYTGDGDGEHRAFWGEDKAQTGGKPGTAALYAMGPLPDTGGWVRLKVPASVVGLAGKAISGVLYGSFDGQTWWGPTTTSSSATDSAPVQMAVDQPASVPATQPGAQIAFRLAQATQLNVEVAGADGSVVRTLLKDQTRPAGFQVINWDAHDDKGALVDDKPYRVRFSAGGKSIAEAGITISPFVARLQTPGAYSVVRGTQVPLIGEAYGTNFSQYVVEFGAGLQPTTWQSIITGTAPVLLPAAGNALRLFNPGNVAQWDTGLNEFDPYHDEGLNGLYTVRLRVTGSDGREAVDSTPVIVGRLAHTAAGGTITSPDGKAQLRIPRLATEDSFTLMTLMPLAQLEPGGDWRSALPAGKQLTGEVYEVLPAGTGFRQAAVLELAYPAGRAVDRLGIWQGDGTAGGWRFLGGSVNQQTQTISVPVVSFGSTRAWVAVFDSPSAGTPPAAANGRLAFDSSGEAPLVVSGTQPFAFYSDLTSGPGEWEAIDLGGTQLTLVRGAQAGLGANGTALQVTRLAGGARVVRVRATAYDAVKYPLLSFDYRTLEESAPNLLVRSHNVWWQFGMGSAGSATTQYFQTIGAAPLNVDGAWHHYQLDLLGALRASQPAATDFQIDEIVLGQYKQTQYNQVVPMDDGAVGSAYNIANFAALGASGQSALGLTWTAPSGAAFNAYSYALDQQSNTLPAEAVQTTAANATMSLPAGAADGLWYAHVRGRESNGRWSATAHFPLVIDRQAPQVGRPDPAPGGAGLADFIQLPIDDSGSGIDLASVRLQLSGKTYGAGPGLTYDAGRHFLELSPYQLKPSPEPITSGQKVELALVAMADYAGNKLVEPFRWSFTADQPVVVGEPFRRLTSAGGEAPALSPDGSQLAFVSKRSGTEKVWLMQADDFDEQAHSARMLIAGTAREADPAWSPDGKQLAFVSDANGSPQIWVSDASGGARALGIAGGAVASPTWSPDGRSLAFVQDGNLWQVNSDGSGLRALTRYPEQPMRAVRWQPGGQLLAVHFKLYQETIELYDLASGELKPLTAGGADMHPAWLNAQTLLYDSPAAAGQPSAIWQINLDGSGAAILTGSAQPGSADMQPAGAGDGSALAIVSTRGGTRNIWLQADLQLTSLDVLPAAGAPADEGFQIEYMLPAAADVTVQVLGSDGSALRTLVDKAQQSKGLQSLTWDGSDAGGKAVAAGNYAVLLSAQVAGGGEPLKRYASARVLDANSVGTLQLQIQQWSGQTVSVTTDLHAEVFEQGIRIRPVAQLDHDANPSFNNLTAGRYDLIVSYGDTQRELDGIKVTGRQITQQRVDLQLGALELSLFSAPGQPAQGPVYVQLARSDDPAHTTVAFTYDPLSTFVLAPGRYDALVQVENVRQTVYALEVRSAQTTRHELNLDSGIIALQVFTSTGQLGESGTGRVYVEALKADDHNIVAATDYNNPTKLLVPAGRYDLRVTYDTTRLGPNTGGTVRQIVTSVDVQAGATVTRDLDLQMGSVHVNVLEAADKPADPARTEFFILQRGQTENQAVTDLFVNSTEALLPAGVYDIGVEYSGTDLHRTDPVGSFEVKEGETVNTTVNLKFGHLRLDVVDANGAQINKEQLSASAYPAGARDTVFGQVYSTNPLDLALRAGASYDIVVSAGDRKLTLPAQSVDEGQVRTLKLNLSDFK